MFLFRLRSPAVLLVVAVMVLVCLHFTPSASGNPQRTERRRSVTERKVKRESDVAAPYDSEREDSESSSEEIIYDQRQVSGETNIRLNIKNFQLRLPESQLVHFQQSDMAQLIRNSVLQLFGLPSPVVENSGSTVSLNSKRPPEEEMEKSKPQAPEQRPTDGETAQEQPLPEGIASMLQVNGNNLPAKFFLEISDFLMNTNDNDAVDDKRVETNHNQQQQIEQQHLQQQQQKQQQQQEQQVQTLRQPSPLLAATPLYAMEEIKIERVANSNNVKNETITISKKIKQVAPVPPNGTALETVSTENRMTSNATRNATANEDRFVQTKPIRLDTVVVRVETDAQGHPKTLRQKVIWKMPDGLRDGNEE